MSVWHVPTLLARMASLGIRPVPPAVMVLGSAHQVTVTAVSSAFVLHRNDEAVTDPQHAPPHFKTHSLFTLCWEKPRIVCHLILTWCTSNNHYIIFNSINFLLLKPLVADRWNKFSLPWFRSNWYMYLKWHSMCFPICRQLSIFVSKPFLFFFLLSPFFLWMVWMWLTVSLKICLFSFRLLCIDG